MGETSDVVADGVDLAFLRELWRINHAMHRMSHRMSSLLGITAQQRLLLRFVGAYPGISPRTLARELFLDEATISESVARLVARGLIQRGRAAGDHRRWELVLTEAGQSILDARGPTIENVLREVLAAAPVATVGTALDLLREAGERIERSLDEPAGS